MQYIDFHCDTLMMFGRPKPQSQIMTEPNSQIASAEGANVTPAPTLYQNDHMVDFVRMKKPDRSAIRGFLNSLFGRKE